MLLGIFYHDIQFFRFYKDGVFLDCLVKGAEESIRVEQIQHWFHRDNLSSGIVRGCYTFKGTRIAFSTLGHFGQSDLIDYEGKSEKDRLILSFLDHNTGHKVINQVFIRLV